MVFTALFSLLALASAAAASPMIKPQQLDVVSPPITSPTSGDVWAPGSTQNVTWDTTGIPKQFAGNQGMIVLGHITRTLDSDGREAINENLNTTNPLATNFTLGAGCQTVIIPSHLPHKKTYIVVLFGDSGNTSPQFTISSMK